jgi:two-component system LytT family sensor kinase
MTPEPTVPAPWRHALVIAAAWFAASLMFLPQSLLLDAQRPKANPFWVVAASNLSVFMLWAVLTPLVVRLAARHPFGRGRPGAALAIHAGFALAFSLGHVLVITLLHYPFVAGRPPFFLLAVNFLVGLGATNVLLYFGVVGAGHALAYLARYREAERVRANAQLAALRAQLHPHFLFNALNAISELVHRDPALADRLLLRLADLLRRVLAAGDVHEVTLAEELAFSRAYLEIQEALMGDRLVVDYDVPDALAHARVPSLLLQPLLENAIRHGLAARRAGGRLRIAARAAGPVLEVEVVDDGAGSEAAPRDGIGLANTRARLATLYGDAGRLEAGPANPGFRARVLLPFRTGSA